MLNQDPASREFEFALQDLVAGLGGPALSQALGINQGYLNRMANPNDGGAFFRAKDLIPVMRLGLAALERERALAPLRIMARALGQALYPVLPSAQPADVIGSLSLTARHMGELGEGAIKAVDPAGEAGPRVSQGELRMIEVSGHNLIGQAAAVLGAVRSLAAGPVRA